MFPTEVQDIYTKVKEGFVQTGLLNLTLLTDLSADGGHWRRAAVTRLRRQGSRQIYTARLQRADR